LYATHSNIVSQWVSPSSSTIKYPFNLYRKVTKTYITHPCTSNLYFCLLFPHTNTNIVQNKKGTMLFQIPNNQPIITMFMFLIFIIINTVLVTSSSSDLKPGYYSKTCPQAEIIVRDAMKKALAREPRSVASVMRFQFHDCFVNVCYSLYSFLLSKFNLFHSTFLVKYPFNCYKIYIFF
jgi:hypothetical protein